MSDKSVCCPEILVCGQYQAPMIASGPNIETTMTKDQQLFTCSPKWSKVVKKGHTSLNDGKGCFRFGNACWHHWTQRGAWNCIYDWHWV